MCLTLFPCCLVMFWLIKTFKLICSSPIPWMDVAITIGYFFINKWIFNACVVSLELCNTSKLLIKITFTCCAYFGHLYISFFSNKEWFHDFNLEQTSLYRKKGKMVPLLWTSSIDWAISYFWHYLLHNNSLTQFIMQYKIQFSSLGPNDI